MKTSQIVLVMAALIVMVFAITFAMNLGLSTDAPTSDKKKNIDKAEKKELPALRFLVTDYPPIKGTAKILEAKKPGHADFYFANPHPTAIKLGLAGKSCKCQDIEVFLATKEYMDQIARNTQVARIGYLASPIVTVFLEHEESRFRQLESGLTKYTLTDKDDGHDIPDGSHGWVRIKWSGENEKANLMKAEVWMHHRSTGPRQNLEGRYVFYPPYRVTAPFENLGLVNPRDLPRQFTIYVTSSTRASLPLTVERLTPKALEGVDPLQVGQAEELNRQECEDLEKELKYDAPVMCGYRISATLLAKVGDRHFDTGPFRRQIRIKPLTKDLNPILHLVVGTIEGEVRVGSEDDASRILLGTFPRSSGSRERKITLSSDVENLKLELDKTRVPEYLDVNFKEITKAAGGRRLWELVVTAPPDKADGVFPRDDHPAYRDSAIYVKSIGATTRYIRIPVEGNANNR